jgi:hypothetical protein
VAIKPSPAADALQVLKLNQLQVFIERCAKPTPTVPAARLALEFEELPVAIAEQQLAFLLELLTIQQSLFKSAPSISLPARAAAAPVAVPLTERFCELEFSLQAKRVALDVLQGTKAAEMYEPSLLIFLS